MPALLPLRHAAFRPLWIANIVTALGTWTQNTGAGWLMTSLPPTALSTSLIQTAAITPALLPALPAGALADTLDSPPLVAHRDAGRGGRFGWADPMPG